MTDHTIAPPPLELVHQWADMLASRSDQAVFTMAAQWGADAELEACCMWITREKSVLIAEELGIARRPRSPSLKEQALDALREAESSGCLYVNGRSDTIRRALNELPDN